MQAELQKLLQEVSVVSWPRREKNIFSIGSRGYYENPTSDLLAFFLNPDEEHGLGDLLLSSLGDLLHDQPSLSEFEGLEREYATEEGNLIDILLKGSGWVIAIENKIRAGPTNPFTEYEATIKQRFRNERPYFVILAPVDLGVENWKLINYRCLIAKAREKLGERLVTLGITKWGMLLREFLIHVEDQLGRPMDNHEFTFVKDHYPEVVKVMALHKDYIKHLSEEITKVGTEILGAPPARVLQQDWRSHGIPLRLYPNAKREHNSTFLVLPEGGFRIQFYVQANERRPNVERAVFTDGGRFADWEDEQRGRIWVFAAKDELNLERAIDTFKASLEVLKNNTQ
jgi:PD-(D/E)XK nuclease superfamily